LQPLDADVFTPFDRHVSAAVKRPSNVKSAWLKVGIHQWSPKAVLEEPAAQAFLREQDEHERREQARRLGLPMILRSQETLSVLHRLSVSPDVQEGSSPVRRVATIALEQEAELAVTKQQLHKALDARKVTPTSRKVLSTRSYAQSRCGLAVGKPNLYHIQTFQDGKNW
jgi:hypothetical protein